MLTVCVVLDEIAAGECGSGGLFGNCKDRTGCSGLFGVDHGVKCCQVAFTA